MDGAFLHCTDSHLALLLHTSDEGQEAKEVGSSEDCSLRPSSIGRDQMRMDAADSSDDMFIGQPFSSWLLLPLGRLNEAHCSSYGSLPLIWTAAAYSTAHLT